MKLLIMNNKAFAFIYFAVSAQNLAYSELSHSSFSNGKYSTTLFTSDPKLFISEVQFFKPYCIQ